MADFDPDAYLKSTALPPVTVNSDNSKSAFDPDAYLGTEPPEPADHGLSERQKLSPVGKALSPVTSYPETYTRMNKEARDQMAEGVQQAIHPSQDADKVAIKPTFDSLGGSELWNMGAGAAKTAAGAANYVLSPVSAAYRSAIGQPLEDTTGIPREYSEFAAQLATPFIGLTGPKATPKAAPPKPAPPSGPLGVTLTEGEQTGELAARQAEQAALRGQAGKPAQEHAEEFYNVQRPQQLEQAKEDVSRSLDPGGQQLLADNPAEAANIVQQSIQKEAARSKADVKDLYDQAKALPGEIHADTFTDMPQSIKTDLSSRPDAVIIDDNTPVATRMITYLDNQIGQLRIKNSASPYPAPPANQITGVNLEGVEQWRKNLSRMRGDALAAYGTNPSDARAAQAVIAEFDNRIQSAVNSGAFTGDPRTVDLYNQARAAHSERMKVYGNDPVGRRIQNILGDAARGKDPASLNDVANYIYSASGTSPNSLNIGVAKRIKKILGEDSPEWAAVRQGLFHRLVSTAEGVADRGYGTVANRLSEFLNGKGSDLAGVIFTPQQRNLLSQYADLHNQLKVPQVAANWSNTAAGIIPHIRAASDKILATVGAFIGHHIMPVAGGFAGWAAGEQAAKVLNKAEYTRNLKQISQQMPLLSHQLKVWQQASLSTARQATTANRRRAMIASTNLTAALSRFSHADPAFAKLLTQGPSGPGTGNASEQQRARGGKIKPTIPLPPLDDNDPDKLSDELIEAAKHFAAGGTPSFDERFQGTSQDNPSVDDMADQVSANAQKNAPDDSWKDREAQAGLALTQPEPTDSRSLGHRIADVAGKFADYDRQFTSDVLHAPQSIYEHGGKFAKKVIGENQDVQDISSPYDPLVIGSNPTEREQTWPERMVRSGATLPHDVATGEVPTYEQDPKTGEWHTSQQMIERAQDTAGMAGSGGLANAEEGAVLNSTPSLRPAMKYKGRIYKGQAGQEHPEVLPDELGADYYHRGMTGGDLSDYETGFLNHKGQFMDRAQALDYGIENGLVSPDAKKYGLLTSPILRSETDKPGTALSALEHSEHAQPFYSAVEKTVESAPQQKMHGVQWANWLKNQPGVKPDELQYTGVDNWLREQKGPVTKQQVQDYIGQNKVQVGDVVKGGQIPRWKNLTFDQQDKMLDRWNRLPIHQQENYASARDYYDALRDLNPEQVDFAPKNPTKYHSYQLPGGENYREHLLTLPDKNETIPWSQQKGDRLRELDRKSANRDLNPVEQQEYNTLSAQATKRDSAPDQFKSSHWDEPNVLAHARTNERDVAGKPSLHIEELQSDWHKTGRKKGYNNEVQDKNSLKRQLEEAQNRGDGEAEHRVQQQLLEGGYGGGNIGVPDAPFKTSWPELAMKRMIQRAATEGKDRISWTPGEAQAARYDLSKQIKELRYTKNEDGTYELGANNNPDSWTEHHIGSKIPESKLADYVGKDVADKIVNGQGKEAKIGDGKILSGVDLKVGGTGMKGFYDQMLPKMVEKLGKQYGVKVKEGQAGDQRARVLNPEGDVINSFDDKASAQRWLDRTYTPETASMYKVEEKPQPVKYFDIPEKMKQDVLSKGFPLFSDTSHGAALAGLEKRAMSVFQSKLKQMPDVDFYHESPGNVATSMREKGIESDYGVFSTIGKPSNFVNSSEKTIVKFKVPKSELSNISPDMRYYGENEAAHHALLKEHPNLIGADVSFPDAIPPSWIKSIQVVGKNKDNVERPKEEKPAERAAGGRVVASNIAIPTEKQKHAGNYSKDHLSVFGLRITVENAKGSKRSGVGKDGKPWESILPAHYGYLKGHEGADGDHVDVYIGPHPKAKSVFVVNQIDPDTKKFDEIKAMLCFGSLHQALNTYKKGFSDGKGAVRIGSIVQTSIEHFKHWLKHHNTKQPFTALN